MTEFQKITQNVLDEVDFSEIKPNDLLGTVNQELLRKLWNQLPKEYHNLLFLLQTISMMICDKETTMDEAISTLKEFSEKGYNGFDLDSHE